MRTPLGNGYYLQLEHSPHRGSAWCVKVFRKRLLFKKRVSSDWFLDEHQARTFAQHLIEEFRNGEALQTLELRKPGWTLNRTRR